MSITKSINGIEYTVTVENGTVFYRSRWDATTGMYPPPPTVNNDGAVPAYGSQFIFEIYNAGTLSGHSASGQLYVDQGDELWWDEDDNRWFVQTDKPVQEAPEAFPDPDAQGFFTCHSLNEMLELQCTNGDEVYRADTNEWFILDGDRASDISNWVLRPTALLDNIRSRLSLTGGEDFMRIEDLGRRGIMNTIFEEGAPVTILGGANHRAKAIVSKVEGPNAIVVVGDIDYPGEGIFTLKRLPEDGSIPVFREGHLVLTKDIKKVVGNGLEVTQPEDGTLLSADSINAISDGGTYTLPPASEVEPNQIVQVEITVAAGEADPLIKSSDGDVIMVNGSPTTELLLDIGHMSLLFISDGENSYKI